ncbi:MAG: LarC family nickel insertion protein [Ignavibacteriales bacterium]|nr:LarC family nickel insertion protein [Ignavibacteriales bacterium]
MCLGALLDLGVDPALFEERMAGLRLPVEIAVRRVRRGGFAALKVDVEIKAGDQHRARRSRTSSASSSRAASRRPSRTGPWPSSPRLFEAEAKVHGRRFKEAHLHEAGADDALVDIVGTAFLLEELGVAELYCSPLNVGSGWVETSHGRLAVPPPAVAELLKKAPGLRGLGRVGAGHPDRGGHRRDPGQRRFLKLPELVYDRIGRGAGTKEFPEIPNILRVYYGDAAAFDAAKSVFVVEATIDDATPQLLAHFLERAFEEGALDATLSPVVMKKNRLGTKLEPSLVEPASLDALIEAVFRRDDVDRRPLLPGRPAGPRPRDSRPSASTARRSASRSAALGGRTVNVQPEYEDLLAAARKTRPAAQGDRPRGRRRLRRRQALDA